MPNSTLNPGLVKFLLDLLVQSSIDNGFLVNENKQTNKKLTKEQKNKQKTNFPNAKRPWTIFGGCCFVFLLI